MLLISDYIVPQTLLTRYGMCPFAAMAADMGVIWVPFTLLEMQLFSDTELSVSPDMVSL